MRTTRTNDKTKVEDKIQDLETVIAESEEGIATSGALALSSLPVNIVNIYQDKHA